MANSLNSSVEHFESETKEENEYYERIISEYNSSPWLIDCDHILFYRQIFETIQKDTTDNEVRDVHISKYFDISEEIIRDLHWHIKELKEKRG